jgi:DNA polymerase elongation subunit (family B)
MASISFKDKAVLAVRQDFFKGIINPEDKIREAIEYYLRNMDGQDKDGNPCQRDLIKERGLKFYIHLVEDEVEVIRTCFNYAHEWKPDIMAVWNLDFDVPHVLRRLEEHGANPADIFCDPAVPRKFRQVAYREGARKQVTNNGTNKALPPAEQWHTFNSMSSYYFIDAMALYKRIRMAKGNEESYALDDVLNKHLGMRKLKFKAADHLIENGSTGLAWPRMLAHEIDEMLLPHYPFIQVLIVEVNLCNDRLVLREAPHDRNRKNASGNFVEVVFFTDLICHPPERGSCRYISARHRRQ